MSPAMGEMDAVGDLIAGGLVGRAVEPGAGEGDGHTHESQCLNCGQPLSGPFCHQCGQHAHVHRTLGAFFHDFAHGVLHFEGKIWRTLPLLAWKPGELTRRYIEGQRARFVSPIALFLFCVFLMFAVLSLTGNANPHFGAGNNLAAAEKETQAKIAKLEKKRTSAGLDADDIKDIDDDIASEKADLTLIRDLRTKGIATATFNQSDHSFNSSVPWIEEAYHKAKENPDLLLYKLKSNSYKWSWAIIPLSVPFLWLMFPFSRRFRVYDHTIFITYSVSFMMLLVTAAVLLSAVGLSRFGAALFLIPPFHMYRQLRGAYTLGRFGAIWRTLLLTVFAILVLIAFILLMGTLGVMD
jgi:hypothetical protein